MQLIRLFTTILFKLADTQAFFIIISLFIGTVSVRLLWILFKHKDIAISWY